MLCYAMLCMICYADDLCPSEHGPFTLLPHLTSQAGVRRTAVMEQR